MNIYGGNSALYQEEIAKQSSSNVWEKERPTLYEEKTLKETTSVKFLISDDAVGLLSF